MSERVCKLCGKTFEPFEGDETEICYSCKNKTAEKGKKYCIQCGRELIGVPNRQTYCDECVTRKRQPKKQRAKATYQETERCTCCGEVKGGRALWKIRQSGALFVCDDCRKGAKEVTIVFDSKERAKDYRETRRKFSNQTPRVLTEEFYLQGARRLIQNGTLKDVK